MKQFFTFLAIVLLTATTTAQIGINNENPDASAALDITSTTGGILIPRLAQTQRDAIIAPAEGLMIYQTDEISGFYFYDGNNWTKIDGVAGPQGETGPAGPPGETGPAGATNLGSVPYLSSSEIGNLSPQNGDLVFDYETSRLLIYVSALSGYNFHYMNYNFQDAAWSTCSTSAQYHMTFQVQVPCAIENIKSRNSGNSNPNHNSTCSIELLLDDDDDLSNGNLGNYEGRVLEVGKYVHLRFPGCSNSGGCYYFYNEAPYDNNSFGTISNYLNYVSNSSYFFDFRYDLSALSSGWNIITDYGD